MTFGRKRKSEFTFMRYDFNSLKFFETDFNRTSCCYLLKHQLVCQNKSKLFTFIYLASKKNSFFLPLQVTTICQCLSKCKRRKNKSNRERKKNAFLRRMKACCRLNHFQVASLKFIVC